MSNAILDKIIKDFITLNSSESVKTNNPMGVTLGVVVDTDDPLECGRLRVFCPALNDDPEKLHHLPWCVYLSPIAGSIDNGEFTRGSVQGQEKTAGSVAYGWWSIPEQGAHVLVSCIDGDVRRRIWLGCVPSHQDMNTLGHGRYQWEGNGGPDGPLAANGTPIEPANTNMKKGFKGDIKSPEWKSRGAEYQACAINKDEGSLPNTTKTELDDQYAHISEAEEDEWVKEKLGAHGYDWSGFKGAGSFKASRVHGFTTPGFHSFTCDDRPFNSRMRFRTTTGHQILLDDTNERIYIATAKGKSWMEMDNVGNIDVYSDRRLSIRSKKDINITSDETVRIKGKKGLHMYSGDTRGQSPLQEVPPDGQIRFHATHDIHMVTEEVYRHYSNKDSRFEAGGNFHYISEEWFQRAKQGVYVKAEGTEIIHKSPGVRRVMDENYTLATTGNILLTSTGWYKLQSGEEAAPQAVEFYDTRSSSEDILGEMVEDMPPFAAASNHVEGNCGIEKLGSFEIDGDYINMQAHLDTTFKILNDDYSSSVQGIKDHFEDIKSKYNDYVSKTNAYFENLELWKTVLAYVSLNPSAVVAVPNLSLSIPEFSVSPPSLVGFPDVSISGDGIIRLSGSVDAFVSLPDLGLADLCIPDIGPMRITAYAGAAASLPPLTTEFVPSQSIPFGDGESGEDLPALPPEAKKSFWTNRVPDHEPWPRVLMQDSDDTVNDKSSVGYKNNVDWIEQFDNEGEAGRKPIGVHEGDDVIDRGIFWRR